MLSEIVEQNKTFIIAEIGVNHNGRLDLAKQMIEEAAHAGADCVKFQTYRASRVVRKETQKAGYQQENLTNNQSQREMLEQLELSKEDHRELKDYTENCGLTFLSTPYNKGDMDFLNNLGVEAFKLASIHAAEPETIRYATSFGKPIFLSTGMTTLSEVTAAVEILEQSEAPYLLMQCTTDYPADEEESNVAVLESFRKSFECPLGFSDHTTSSDAACAAVALGAEVIEKHFTLDKSLEGPDHRASADPSEFEDYVRAIKRTERVLGNKKKQPTESERENMNEMRRSLTAKREIAQGEVIDESHLTFKRPGTGLPPRLYDMVVGREASREIEVDELIDWGMIR